MIERLENKGRLLSLLALLLAAVMVLAACGGTGSPPPAADSPGTSEETPSESGDNTENGSEDKEDETEEEEKAGELTPDEQIAVYQRLLEALEQEQPSFDTVLNEYQANLQGLVQRRDQERSSSVDQQITAALTAGQNGEMAAPVVKQLFDKLMQRVFFFTVRHEFSEIAEYWGDEDEVQAELEEAKTYYGQVLRGTVQKRDAAYGTNLEAEIDAGFQGITDAIESDSLLDFKVSQQIIDKTLMKTFYLATGALPNGYASKVAAAAADDPEEAKVEQAEAWAFYQSIRQYLASGDQESAEFIERQLDLETDVTEVDPEAINQAFIQAITAKAKGYVEETMEAWGEDKSAVEAMEAAMFIRMIDLDIQRILGDGVQQTLEADAQAFYEAVRSQDRETAETKAAAIQSTLDTLLSEL